VRAAIKWLFHKTLSFRQDIAFFMVVPLTLMLTLLAFRYNATGALNLKLQIDGLGVSDDQSAGATTVILIASLRNLGAPTIAEKWVLTAEGKLSI